MCVSMGGGHAVAAEWAVPHLHSRLDLIGRGLVICETFRGRSWLKLTGVKYCAEFHCTAIRHGEPFQRSIVNCRYVQHVRYLQLTIKCWNGNGPSFRNPGFSTTAISMAYLRNGVPNRWNGLPYIRRCVNTDEYWVVCRAGLAWLIRTGSHWFHFIPRQSSNNRAAYWSTPANKKHKNCLHYKLTSSDIFSSHSREPTQYVANSSAPRPIIDQFYI